MSIPRGLRCFAITPQRRLPCVVLSTAKNFHRIAVKKLRYAGDFFGRLFSGHKAKKRLSAYEDSLKELQDPLGALNDIQVHQKMVPELASGKPRTNRRERVFAAGVVSGREQSEIEPLLNSASKEASKFAQIRSFWT